MKHNPSIRLVDDGRSRLMQPTSEARLRLAKLISGRVAIEDGLRSLVAAGAKLAEAADAERNAGAKLAALDAEEAATMAAWAKAGGQMPQFDRTRREKLEAECHASAAQAAAARKAASANGSEQQRELGRLKGMEPEFAAVIATIIDEEMAPLIADYQADSVALAGKAALIQQGAEALTRIAHDVGDTNKARPAFVVLEKLNEKLRIAFSRPAVDSTGAGLPKWLAFAAALRREPIAEFKS